MTLGVGGQSAEAALASLSNMMGGVRPIGSDEFQARLQRAQALMRERGWPCLAKWLLSGLKQYNTGCRATPPLAAVCPRCPIRLTAICFTKR